MKEYHWNETLERAVEAFGGYPDAELEQELLDVFRERPQRVQIAIADVTGGYQAGRISKPWPFLRSVLRRSVTDAVVSDEGDRRRREQLAERWVRTAGIQFDRESEVDDELFGDRGLLRSWAGDEALRERLTALWRELRPHGELIERQAEEAVQRRIEVRQKLVAKLKAKRDGEEAA